MLQPDVRNAEEPKPAVAILLSSHAGLSRGVANSEEGPLGPDKVDLGLYLSDSASEQAFPYPARATSLLSVVIRSRRRQRNAVDAIGAN